MKKRLFIPLAFGLSAMLACSLARTDIRVVATPVALPGPTLPPAAGETLPTQVVPAVATPGLLPDTADVYAEANAGGGLILHYADPSTGRELTTTTVGARDVFLAGDKLFFAGENGGPVLVRPDGQHVPFAFIAPGEDTDFFQFLISADGSTQVWLDVTFGEESNPTTIWAGWETRNAILPIYQSDAPPDGELRLVSLSADGSILYLDTGVELLALDVNGGETTELPAEPGCGDAFSCEATISDDGRFLLRAKNPASADPEPLVVHDIASGREVARFAAQPLDESEEYAVGDPIFSPDQDYLVYVLAEGPPGQESYRYFRADLATGEQTPVAESGTTRLRPLRWLDDPQRDTLVLTAEPSVFDEWHLDVTTGELARVSDRLYIGRVALP